MEHSANSRSVTPFAGETGLALYMAAPQRLDTVAIVGLVHTISMPKATYTCKTHYRPQTSMQRVTVTEIMADNVSKP